MDIGTGTNYDVNYNISGLHKSFMKLNGNRRKNADFCFCVHVRRFILCVQFIKFNFYF